MAARKKKPCEWRGQEQIIRKQKTIQNKLKPRAEQLLKGVGEK